MILVPCCDVRYDFCIKMMFGSSLPSVVCRSLISYLRYLWVFWRIVVSNTYCVVFIVLFVLYFVYQMLPVSLDCPFVIVPSVFSNVYLIRRDWRRRRKQQFDRFPAGKSYDFIVFLTRGEYTNYNYIRVYSTTCKRLL